MKLTHLNFYNKYKTLIINIFSKNHKFTRQQLSDLEHMVNWDLVSANEKVKWDSDFIASFSEQLNWKILTENTGVIWTEEMFDRFCDKINWQSIYLNSYYPFSAEVIRKYKHKLQVENLLLNENISIPTDVFEEMIRLGLASNHDFSQAVNVNFTEKLIEKYADLWDWEVLTSNPAVPFSDDLVKKYNNRWIFSKMVLNTSLFDRLDFMEKYTLVDYEWLSSKKKTGWTIELIDQNKDKLDWEDLSCNKHLPWSESFFKRYFDRWDFYLLSSNESLPWTEELVEAYEDMWNWSDIGAIGRFGSLSKNKGLPWSYDFIKKYARLWEWGNYTDPYFNPHTCGGASEFITKEWSLEQLFEFEKYYDWDFMVDHNPDLYSIFFSELKKNQIAEFVSFIADEK